MDSPLARLRQFIVNHHDLEELRTLCFDLAVPYDELGPERLSVKARELVLWAARRRKLDPLLKRLRGARPRVFARLGINPDALEAMYDTLPAYELSPAAYVPPPPPGPAPLPPGSSLPFRLCATATSQSVLMNWGKTPYQWTRLLAPMKLLPPFKG